MDHPFFRIRIRSAIAPRPWWLCQRAFALLLGITVLMASKANAGAPSPQSPDQGRDLTATVLLADLIEHAYTHNPSIQQAREAWRATVENYRVATGYPDPQLMVTWFPEPIETRLGPQEWNAQISQKIPFPGKLSKAGDLVAADARMAKLQLDKAVKGTLLAVKESYYELWYIRQARMVTRHNTNLLNHIRKIAETAHADNRTTLTDVVKAQSQTGQLQYDALLLEELEQTEVARLNGLLNRPPDLAVGQLAPPALLPIGVELKTIYDLAEANQEDILMAQVDIEKGDTKVSLARFQNLPDFKVGLFYAGIGEPDVPVRPRDAGRDAIGLQAGISIPLWFGRNSSRVNKAMAEKSRARSEKQVRINNVRTRIRTLYFKARNAKRVLILYKTELVPQAARSMELAELWYREGEASFSDFIETQSVWYNFQLALARATADYGINLARLERAAGRHLTGEAMDAEGPAGKELP
ncbi:PTS cellobiose transporter subunit IIC [Desulfosarcina alkanivorans]|uniref:PTS cellobiose transporter subunit IIC n=1 Tax=Desulfosarcina alkanivorans TaxID=571177 RepID=A0A5K7YR98_9BACT|nr:TolC family protein [Desulfosarcina alkanivorans]BBO69511.1 PTS cellobiose transporter subunit IIC [Desulfosarcina alkanivorans]